MKRLLVSFSGGETSAYMAQWIKRNWAGAYDEIAYVFANTGQENEETLEFAHRCDQEFGLDLVWIEADVVHGERVAPRAKVVSFETADRAGKPFEEVVKKYGIANQAFPVCSTNLKRYPIQDYARRILGWGNDYDLAIGIRRDEIDRIAASYKQRRIVYPLIKPHPMSKPQINTWWEAQSFRLPLKGYQGNCKWCWKKSDRKLLTIMSEAPHFFDFPERLEQEYGLVGAEFSKPGLAADYRRTWWRGNRSTADLKAILADPNFTLVRADDDARVYDPDFDVAGACGEESCEVFGGEDDDIDYEEVIARKRAGKRSGNNHALLGKIVRPLVEENPRRQDTHGWRSFEIMRGRSDLTLAEYYKLGGRSNDLAWDIARGWAEIVSEEQP